MKTLTTLHQERLSLLAALASLQEEIKRDEGEFNKNQNELRNLRNEIDARQRQERQAYEKRYQERLRRRASLELQISENQSQKHPAYEAEQAKRRDVLAMVSELLSSIEGPLPPAGEALREILKRRETP